MNTKLTQQKIVFFLMLFTVKLSFGQRSLKFENGGGPSGSGPSTSNKVVTMYNGDAGAYSPTTTVTYALSNQQYGTVEGYSSLQGIQFGAGANGSGNSYVANAYYPLMNSISGPSNTQFSIAGATPAINIANDYAIEVITISDALINANGTNKIPTNSKDVYYGDLVLTFNRPVNNPVIHFTGMGGFFQQSSSSGTLGFSAGFELTDAYSVSKLAGNNYFTVSGKKIYNAAPTYHSNTSNSAPAASSGSIQVSGSNIRSLTFKVYMNGDGQGTSPWSATNRFNGDAFLVAVSLTTYNISGNVFNDANGMNDNTVNGTGTNAGGLNAVLIDPATGNVAAVVPVNADGTYGFTNILSADYSIAITRDAPATGSSFPGVVLPDGWTATGETQGTASGSDGTANGILTGVSLNSNLTNANFGIEQVPVTDNKEQTIPIPTNNSIPQGTLNTPVSGSDAEDGPLGNNNTIVITELPINGTLYYNGSAVTAGQAITGFDPALLSFTDLQAGTSETGFKYSFTDAAGKQSMMPGTYTVKWNGALSVMFGPVTASWSNGQLEVNWSTFTEQDNDHFEIEGSKDGIHFTRLGSVHSNATNGFSTAELHYSFSKSIEEAAALAGVGLLIAGLLFSSTKRSNRFFSIAIAFVAAATIMISCNKKNDTFPEQDQPFYIRVVQVDKNGTRNVSKTVKVTEADR